MARKKATAEAVVTNPVVEEVNVTVEAAEPEKKTRTRKAAAPKAEKPAAEKKAPVKRTSKKAVAAEEVKAEAAPAVEAPAAETPVAAPAAEAAPAEKKAPAKRTAKKPAEVKASVSVQFSGKEYTTADLVEIAKAVWQYDLGQKPEDFKSVELYVKTEESSVYYVINGDTTGRFGI